MTKILWAAIAALFIILAVAVGTKAEAADVAVGRAIDDKDRGFLPSVTAVENNPFAGFYAGIVAGVQFTDITITDTFAQGDNLSGISADGGLLGVGGGFNFCVGRICVGPYVEYALADVSFDVLGEPLLVMDDYVQVAGQVGILAGKSTLISLKFGHEWQTWTVGQRKFGIDEVDAESTAWVIGGSVATLVAPNTSLDLSLDYLMFDTVESQGDDYSRNLEDSTALRAKIGLTYRPAVGLPALN